MRTTAIILACLAAAAARAADDKPTLAVSISPDIPPYVAGKATGGLAVALLREALPGRRLDFVQVPHQEIEDAVADGRADAGAFALGGREGLRYSRSYLAFEDYVVTRRADGLDVRSVGDLAGRPVLTWQGAWRELGPAFEALFGPGGPGRPGLEEFVRQREQVRAFWARRGAVAVIDRRIFEHFNGELGHAAADAVLHDIFPSKTVYKAAFRDAAARDEFDAGLAALCGSGRYAALLARHGGGSQEAVCGRP